MFRSSTTPTGFKVKRSIINLDYYTTKETGMIGLYCEGKHKAIVVETGTDQNRIVTLFTLQLNNSCGKWEAKELSGDLSFMYYAIKPFKSEADFLKEFQVTEESAEKLKQIVKSKINLVMNSEDVEPFIQDAFLKIEEKIEFTSSFCLIS